MKSSTVVLALLSNIAIVSCYSVMGADLITLSDREALDHINKYLTQKVGDDDAKKNLDTAANWLQELIDEGSSDSNLITALKNLVDLHVAIVDPKCSKGRYLLNGYRSVFNTSANPEPKNRVEKVVYNAVLSHAISCKEHYPFSYQQLSMMIYYLIPGPVNRWAGPMLENRLKQMQRDGITSKDFFNLNAINHLESYPLGGLDQDGQLTLHELQVCTKEDSRKDDLVPKVDPNSGKKTVDKSKVNDIINQCLVSHCEKYNEKCGYRFFYTVPLEYGILIKEGKLDDNVKPDKKLSNFYYGLGLSTLCEHLTRGTSVITDSVSDEIIRS